MPVSLLLQKGAPDLTNAIIILIAILFTLLLLNSLYEWLRSKPWQDRGNPNPSASSDEVTTEGGNTTPDQLDNSSESKFLDHGSLGLPIGC